MADPSASLLSWFTPTALFLLLNLVVGAIALTSRYGSRKNPQQPPQEEEQLRRAPSLLDRVRSINFSQYKFEQPDLEPEAFRPAGPEYVDQNLNSDNPTRLARAPSLLDRMKSMDFSHYIFEDRRPEPAEPEHVAEHPNPLSWIGLARTPSLLNRLKSMDYFSFHSGSEQPGPKDKTVDPSGSGHEARDPIQRHENLVHRSKSDSGSGGAQVNGHEKKMKKSASEKSQLGGGEKNDAVEDRRPATTRVEKTRAFVGEDKEVDAKADDFINRFKQQLRLQRLNSLVRYKEMLKRN